MRRTPLCSCITDCEILKNVLRSPPILKVDLFPISYEYYEDPAIYILVALHYDGFYGPSRGESFSAQSRRQIDRPINPDIVDNRGESVLLVRAHHIPKDSRFPHQMIFPDPVPIILLLSLWIPFH